MHLALGYADGVPAALRDDAGGGKDDYWILTNVGAWFPEHEVRVWGYGGCIPSGSLDWDAWLIAYGYSISEDVTQDVQHFVIGAPDFRMAVTIVVGVRLTARG